jgi:hypothetical protein
MTGLTVPDCMKHVDLKRCRCTQTEALKQKRTKPLQNVALLTFFAFALVNLHSHMLGLVQGIMSSVDV